MGRFPVIELRKDTITGLLEYTITLDERLIHVYETHKNQASACKNAIDAFQTAIKRSAIQGGPRDRIHTIFNRFESQEEAANFLEWLTQHGFITLDVRNAARISVEGAETPEVADVTAEYKVISDDTSALRCVRTPEVWGSTHAEGREVAIFRAVLDLAHHRPEFLSKYAAAKDSGGVAVRTGKTVRSQGDSLAGNENTLAEDASFMGPPECDISFQSALSTSLNVSHTSHTLMESVPNLASFSDSGIPAPDDLSQRGPR